MEGYKKKVLLKDIAHHLGVTPSTVSMALKDHPDLSRATILKIKKLAAEWNYRPGPIAHFSNKQATKTLGVVVPDITTLFYPAIICGIEEVAKANGYNVVITTSQDSYIKEKENLHKLLKLQVDGLLVCLAQQTADFSHYDLLINASVPLVFFDRLCHSSEVSSVTPDLAAAVQKLSIHLFEQGATRIAFVEGGTVQYGNEDKIRGYRKGLQACRLSFDEKLLVHAGAGEEEIERAIHELLSLSTPPDAIIGANDAVIFSAFKEIKKRGLKIPDDIKLGAFIDAFHGSLLEPPLTTIVYPHAEVGQEAARLLLQEIESGKKVVQHISMPATLILRDSSK